MIGVHLTATDDMCRAPRPVSYEISPDAIPAVHLERAWQPVLSPTSVVSQARSNRASARCRRDMTVPIGAPVKRHWGPLSPHSVGATTRDEQWTVCRDMIRGGRKGPRAHFTRATISSCRLPHPLAPFEHRRLGTIPASLVGRVRFAPATTCFAPDHKPEMAAAALPSVIGGPRTDRIIIFGSAESERSAQKSA
jgi:hypothetical protein